MQLGNLVTFKTGKLDSNAAVPGGEYPFFTCAKETYQIDKFAFDTECVLLAGNNANGVFSIKYYSGKFNAYQRTYIIEPKNREELSTNFLYYALQLKLRLLQGHSAGTATKYLTLPILNELQIDVPDFGIQNKITSILSAYDDLIENNNRRIALLEESMRLLYREWFVRLRFPGHEHVRVIDGLPERWERTTIDQAFSILGGGTPSKGVQAYWQDGEINWFTPTDLTKAQAMFAEESISKITADGLANSSAKLFPPYSIMMTSRATIGAIAINTTEACTNQGFIACLPNERVPLYFLFHWLKDHVEEFISHATGATFKEITKGVFRQLPIILPDQDTMLKYEETVKPMAECVLNLQRQNKRLSEARDLLLPRLMSGEIDVS
ncbi:MAG: restriction endonuclease subunit S [Chloroflexi bacterium]|jgi:type I restriction enzyme S subunit|nr:restriction endonuclease subunit S [Chloroflexota bacterium]